MRAVPVWYIPGGCVRYPWPSLLEGEAPIESGESREFRFRLPVRDATLSVAIEGPGLEGAFGYEILVLTNPHAVVVVRDGDGGVSVWQVEPVQKRLFPRAADEVPRYSMSTPTATLWLE